MLFIQKAPNFEDSDDDPVQVLARHQIPAILLQLRFGICTFVVLCVVRDVSNPDLSDIIGRSPETGEGVRVRLTFE